MHSERNNIVWIVSYPKSGNTWFRIFIQNLLSDSESPIDINNITSSHISTNRSLFDDLIGISSSDLTFEEIDTLRPFVYENYSSLADTITFLKVHDMWSLNSDGQPLFPSHITKAVVYIIRNPFDVVVSLANHNSISLDAAVKLINDSENSYCANTSKLASQLRHRISSWSEHVNSWVKESNLPVHVMKYEDMHENSFITFRSAIKSLNLQCSNKQIEIAIKNSDFKLLQEQEKKFGFKEKPQNVYSFFKSGKIDNWKHHLTEQMILEIASLHGKTMAEYGYQVQL